MTDKLPIIISIPHGGTAIPGELDGKTWLNVKDIFEDGDALTQKIYDFSDAVHYVVKTPIARAFVDLNRAPDDRPPDNPDGVVKTRTVNGKKIFKSGTLLGNEQIRVLLKRYYYPFHDRLTHHCRKKGLLLGLDCHSMLTHTPATSIGPKEKRPLFCLSNRGGPGGYANRKFPTLSCTPEQIQKLALCLRKTFNLDEKDVLINHPFHGGYIIQRHGLKPLPWIQMEMNRKLYLDAPFFDPTTLTVVHERIAWLKERFYKTLKAYFDAI